MSSLKIDVDKSALEVGSASVARLSPGKSIITGNLSHRNPLCR